MSRPVALVRAVPDSFSDCVTAAPPVPPLDPVVAREQHHCYAAALEAGGFAVVTIPGDEAHPDSPFIEDTAVIIDDAALLTHPGNPSRRGEVAGTQEALAGLVAVERMPVVGTLDGGDVLQVGRTVLIGLGRRTDQAGADSLEAFARARHRSVRRVPVRSTLHLKSGLSAVDDETVLWHPAACDRDLLDGLRVVEVPGDDPEAANVVRLPDGAVLVAAHQPRSAELVAGLGLRPVAVDVSEFARADGGLTCLSLRMRSVYRA